MRTRIFDIGFSREIDRKLWQDLEKKKDMENTREIVVGFPWEIDRKLWQDLEKRKDIENTKEIDVGFSRETGKTGRLIENFGKT